MQLTPDKNLIARLNQGDLSAFDELYLKYFKLLCVSAYFHLKDEQEAKDLVQNLFLDIWDRELFVNFNDEIKAYLLRAVRNRSLNRIRMQRCQQKDHSGYLIWQENGMEELDQSGPVSDEEQLHIVLKDIPCRKKEAINMVYFEGKKYSDAADNMKISVNSLKTHLRTGLNLLRGEFRNKFG